MSFDVIGKSLLLLANILDFHRPSWTFQNDMNQLEVSCVLQEILDVLVLSWAVLEASVCNGLGETHAIQNSISMVSDPPKRYAIKTMLEWSQPLRKGMQ